MVNKILNISLVKKVLKKNRPVCIFCSQMIIYKRNFDEDRHFFNKKKKENVFIKYMKILENVRNIIKKIFNSELTYSKRYLQAENKRQKEGFQCFHAPLIFFE